MRGIDGNDEADRDVLLGRHLRDDDRAKPAHRMPDQHDRRRRFLVAGDGTIADPSADGEFIDVGRKAGLRQLLFEPVHAGGEERPHGATEQVDFRRRQRLERRGRGGGGGGAGGGGFFWGGGEGPRGGTGGG